MRARHYILLGSSLITLLLAMTSVTLARYQKHVDLAISAKEADLQTVNQEINNGLTSRKTAEKILSDLAPLAQRSDRVRQIFTQLGFTWKNPTDTPTNP